MHFKASENVIKKCPYSFVLLNMYSVVDEKIYTYACNTNVNELGLIQIRHSGALVRVNYSNDSILKDHFLVNWKKNDKIELNVKNSKLLSL